MSFKIITLNNLKINKRGEVLSLFSSGNERRRFLDLGLVSGTIVEAIQKSPSGDPTAYLIRGTVIALRNDDANKVLLKIES